MSKHNKHYDERKGSQNSSRYSEKDKRRHSPQRKDRSTESSQHRGESSSNYPVEDREFSWIDHRHVLNKMFFGDRDVIKKGTEEYRDFWSFLEKYQRMKHSKPNFCTVDNKKLNFQLTTDSIDDLMVKGCLFKDDQAKDQLNRAKVEEFSSILHLYVDFLQKQKFAKLCKLRKAQTGLPIANFFQKILHTVRDHQVVLVAGDTGCGKSTQVPQYLMSAGFTKIACTQPRRIACISLAKRVSYETLNEYGDQVGYQIRFERRKTQHTKITFLTEGLLLRQVASDPSLSNYEVVILDEVHERHLTCDFLLGVVKCLIHQRKDLKLILMSATINIDLFSQYFNNCPVVQVPGRLYPIKILYQPVPMVERSGKSGGLNPGPYLRILQQIDDKYPVTERGDLLIFLSGITEITAIMEAVQAYAEHTKRWIVLPLHSTLSIAEQDKVFDYAPEGIRKCVVSTNIAETSVTIDGVRFVLDSGKVKEMSYDPTCRMQRLKEFWVSKASAEQRKGRAGRTGPGVCYRLFSEKEYQDMSAYSTPEIQRVPLDSTLLQMIAMGLPNARQFPFLEPPPATSIEEALQGLKEQGALSESETLTTMGQMLSQLPVDVSFGKMLILGSVFAQEDSILALTAALSVQSPFTNRSYRDLDAIAARKSLQSDNGDPLTLLNAYNEWIVLKADRGSNTRKWCKRRGFEEQRFYEITKLRQQFKDLLKESGFVSKPARAAPADSHERMQRHGELRSLYKTKSEWKRAPRKRKYLKMNEVDGVTMGSSEEEEEEEFDIQDVEFRISNDRNKIRELSKSGTRSYTLLNLLKIILCSGLYPQVAISDEHNIHKSDAEQLFHTRGKPFVALHPTAVFALEPNLLRLNEIDCIPVQGFISRGSLSTKHQLVAYVTLLETTKPYLLNCLRVPAAHTLLLLGHNLDTNNDLTRIFCDQWLELRFPHAHEAQQFLAQAIIIRDLWKELLESFYERLKEKSENKDQEVGITPEARKMQKKLLRAIDEYQRTEILHTIRRLLPADLKGAYCGPANTDMDFNNCVLGFDTDAVTDFVIHPSKGGYLIRDYLIYGCLIESDDKVLKDIKKEWICPGCNKELRASVLEQVRHRAKCQELNQEKEPESEKKSLAAIPKGSKSYDCKECGLVFRFTSIEILKHKKMHEDT